MTNGDKDMQIEKQAKVFNTLLIEDSLDFREILKSVIIDHFPLIHIDEAGAVNIALKKISILTPDLVFMDIKLPDGNGIVLTKYIKMQHKNIVIVVLSSYDVLEYRQAAFRNGADCFLAKESISCMEDVIARVEGTITAKTYQAWLI